MQKGKQRAVFLGAHNNGHASVPQDTQGFSFPVWISPLIWLRNGEDKMDEIVYVCIYLPNGKSMGIIYAWDSSTIKTLNHFHLPKVPEPNAHFFLWLLYIDLLFSVCPEEMILFF